MSFISAIYLVDFDPPPAFVVEKTASDIDGMVGIETVSRFGADRDFPQEIVDCEGISRFQVFRYFGVIAVAAPVKPVEVIIKPFDRSPGAQDAAGSIAKAKGVESAVTKGGGTTDGSSRFAGPDVDHPSHRAAAITGASRSLGHLNSFDILAVDQVPVHCSLIGFVQGHVVDQDKGPALIIAAQSPQRNHRVVGKQTHGTAQVHSRNIIQDGSDVLARVFRDRSGRDQIHSAGNILFGQYRAITGDLHFGCFQYRLLQGDGQGDLLLSGVPETLFNRLITQKSYP